MKIRAKLAAIAIVGTLGLAGSEANAVALVDGSGWVEDQVTTPNAPSPLSPLPSRMRAAHFSLTHALVIWRCLCCHGRRCNDHFYEHFVPRNFPAWFGRRSICAGYDLRSGVGQ